ncbi:MAG: hypothetical protein U0841_12780 [Chloroflexia bacterium]
MRDTRVGPQRRRHAHRGLGAPHRWTVGVFAACSFRDALVPAAPATRAHTTGRFPRPVSVR